MEQTSHNKKYPKSIHGYQCVGPCRKKNSAIIHPIYFNIIQNEKYDFCPTNEWIYTNNTGNIQRFYTDKCVDDIVEKNDNKNNTTDHTEILYPYTNFDEIVFLDSFYNINDLGQAMDWIDNNKNLPISSRQRIFDLSIIAFKNNFEVFDFNDTRIVDFVLELIRKKYNDHFCIEFFKYIMIEGENVIIKYDKNYSYDNETNDTIIIKQNFIIKHLMTLENITSFINIFFRKTENNSDTEINKYPSEILIDKLILFIIGNIKKTFIK